MSPGRNASDDSSFARSAGGAATRGIILIVVAVLVGVVLIATAVDDTNQITAAGPGTTAPPATAAPTDTSPTTAGDPSAPATTAATPATTAAAAPTDTGAATPTTTAGAVFEPRPNSVVSVQVANTTRVGGAAGRMTDTLKAQGYVTLTAVTDTGGVQAITKIHHVGGYLLEAQKMAGLLSLDPEASVFSMPSNPGATISDYAEPNILVLLGSELAN